MMFLQKTLCQASILLQRFSVFTGQMNQIIMTNSTEGEKY